MARDAQTESLGLAMTDSQPLPRPLQGVTRYSNGVLIDRFLSMYDIEEELAKQFFEETKKWLWLCSLAHEVRRRQQTSFRLVIDDHLIFIDEMWHNFILFTKDYHDFCMKYLGVFIHHQPTPPKRRQRQRREVIRADGSHARLMNSRRRQYEFIHDALGAETLVLWYEEFGQKYSRAWFRERLRTP